MTLECSSCHNPHGNDKYRMLRPQPVGLTTDKPTATVNMTAVESPKTYTLSYSGNYTDYNAYPATVLSYVSEWCAQCHKRYHADAGSATTPQGDAVFKYRHATNSSTVSLFGECLACHVAHGTSATMSSYASSHTAWPGGNTSDPSWQTGENSRLLRINNRGVCIRCHSSSLGGN
jgi:hypothetical protein